MRVSPDGFWRPDVWAQFITDDEAVVLMHYTGLSKSVLEFVGRRTVCTRHLAIPSLFNHNPSSRDHFVIE